MHQYKVLNFSEVTVPEERQRSSVPPEHISELSLSILENGLLHAPVVNASNQLVAGYCRLQAIELLILGGQQFYYNGEQVPLEQIPVVITHHESEAALYRIELEENLRRKNLSHVDQAMATVKLHKLLGEGNPLATVKDTARELAGLQGTPMTSATERRVAESLLISQFANDPSIMKAPTHQAAVKLAKKKMEQDVMAALGGTIDSTTHSHQIICGDAFEEVKNFLPGSFDVILTDPPYGMDAHTFGSQSFMGEAHKYKDSKDLSDRAYHLLAEQGYFLLGPDGYLIAFCDIQRFAQVSLLFQRNDWKVWPTPLIWAKGPTGHAPQPEFGPKRVYEALLFARKGDRKIQKLGSDVLIYPSVHSSNKTHAAEKPVALLEELLAWTTYPGCKVLDPFAGSGSILEAGENAGCQVTAIELDQQNANRAKLRMKEMYNATAST